MSITFDNDNAKSIEMHIYLQLTAANVCADSALASCHLMDKIILLDSSDWYCMLRMPKIL